MSLTLPPELLPAVYRAAARPEVRRAVADLYERLQQEIAQSKPICVSSGRCCRFEEFDHRLYVTTIELAAFVYELQVRCWPEALDDARRRWAGRGCPFQVEKLCGVHAIRPFGCRVFFCDDTATQWQHERYEQYHGELKRLHAELDVPYAYLEWREALSALGLAR